MDKQFLWTGGTHNVGDPTAWSPTGLPGTGDQGFIVSGNALAIAQAVPGNIELGSTIPDGATFNAFESTISGSVGNLDPMSSSTVYGSIGLVGANASSGSIDASIIYLESYSSAYLTADLADMTSPAGVVIQRAVLTNTGTISTLDNASLTVQGPVDGEIVNTGSINLYESGMTIDTAITGAGSISLTGFRDPGRLTLNGAVAAGQTVTVSYGTLTLDDPLNFRGTVADFGTIVNEPPEIDIPGVTVTSAFFINHVLTLMSGSTLVSQFKFADTITDSAFIIQASGGETKILPPYESSGNVTVQTAGTAPVAPPIVLPKAIVPLPNAGPDITLTTGAKTASAQRLDGYSIRLAGASAASAPSVNTTSTVFGTNFHLLVQGQPSGPAYGTFAAVGYSENDGTIETVTSHAGGAATLAFSITDVVSPTGTTILTGAYNNAASGTIEADAGTTIDITGSAASKMVNAGHIHALGSLILGTNITGTGSITIGDNAGTAGSLEAKGPVSTGQAVTLNAGTLTIDNAKSFYATIYGFDAKDTIVLKGQDVTAVTYNNGALQLDGGTDGTLHLRRPAGVTFDTNSFVVGHTGSDTTITFRSGFPLVA